MLFHFHLRADSDFVKEVVKPFDWTFTTDYKGTMFGKEGAQMHVSTLNMYKLEISVLSLYIMALHKCYGLKCLVMSAN